MDEMKCICHSTYLYDIIDYIVEEEISIDEAVERGVFGGFCQICIPHARKLLKKLHPTYVEKR